MNQPVSKTRPRLHLVVAGASAEKLDAFLDPEVAVVVVVPLDRDVVRNVPGLKPPDADVVGLQLGELVERRLQSGPVFGLFRLVGLFPQDIGRHAAQPERGQLDRFARRIDLAQVGLAKLELIPELRQAAARPGLFVAHGHRRRLAVVRQRQQQNHDQRQIRELSNQRSPVHFATSRTLKNRKPAISTGTT